MRSQSGSGALGYSRRPGILIVTHPRLSFVKQRVPGTNYKTKIIKNQNDFLNEFSFYNLYQNELLYKTKSEVRHYESEVALRYAIPLALWWS